MNKAQIIAKYKEYRKEVDKLHTEETQPGNVFPITQEQKERLAISLMNAEILSNLEVGIKVNSWKSLAKVIEDL